MSSRTRYGTLAIVAIYLVVMILTNGMFTILDDEAAIIAIAGHPIVPTMKLFLSGAGQHEHPPASDILLHLWLLVTGFSFFGLRVFANIFSIVGVLFTALSAERIGGRTAYWVTLVLGYGWPFGFQYGRIAGWYSCCMFLVALLTWLYFRILDERGYCSWAGFATVSILLVWSNYFGAVILLLLLFDYAILHRKLAARSVKPLLISAVAITLSSLPLLGIVWNNVAEHSVMNGSAMDWRRAIADAGFTIFSILGSVAVAPWFLPLSIPVFLAAIALFVAIWFSPGRRWAMYFLLTMILLQLSGHMQVKRVLFLLPWLFVAMGIAVSSGASRYPKLASGAIAAILIAGWIGIVSGKHYAETNLNEPWERVAAGVATDTRSGATVISGNPSFFFYLNYQLGLESETRAAQGAYLSEGLYRSHGYKVLEPDNWQVLAETLHGKVVVVKGPASKLLTLGADVLADRLRARCTTLGEYLAAPDPAVALKREFVKDAPALTYRTDVTWFDCLSQEQ